MGASLLTISLVGVLACCSVSAASQAHNGFLAANDGFCPGGINRSPASPESKPKNIKAWGSYCDQGDRTVGSAATAPFPAPARLMLYLAGYPDHPGVSLELESLADHSKLCITPHESPGERWLDYCFVLPGSWVGIPVRLLATDSATGPRGWLAFSEPLSAPVIWNFGEAANLLLRTTSHFLLLCVVCFAVCAYAVSRGVRDIVVLALIALVGVAAPGYVVFWLWLWSGRIGHAISFLIPLLAAVSLLLIVPRIGRSGLRVLRPLVVPAALVFSTSLWILSAGFAYGGMRTPFATAWTRFSYPLPPDNMIPYLFAEAVGDGHVPTPLFGDWLSSDRPPLQTAIALSQYPYLPQPRALGHTVLAVILQSLWILALWILLVAFEINPRAIALVLATLSFSGFVLVNSFFVWPKLLAATYIVALATILLVDRYSVQLPKSNLLCSLAGAFAAFGLLSHGGSAFGIIGILFTYVLLRKRLPLKSLTVIAVAFLLLYLPWTLYQKYYDPPGNRLLKLHLAGIERVDSGGLRQALGQSYSQLTLKQWITNREANVSMVIDHQREYWSNVEALFLSLLNGQTTVQNRASEDLRAETFLYFSCSLGFLIAGPLLLLPGIQARYRTHTGRVATLFWLFVTCTLVAWCLIMFVPGSTSIHQGTYTAPLLAITGSVLALWSVSPWLAYMLSGLQILQTILIYAIFMRSSPIHGALLEGTVHGGTATLFISTFVLSSLLIMQLGREPTPGTGALDHELITAPESREVR